MTLISQELFDGGTTGASISESGSWSYQLGAGGTAATYQTIAAAHGAEGMRITDVTVFNNVRYDNTTAIPTMVNSFYFQLAVVPSANCYLGALLDGSNTKTADWRVNPDLTVTLRDGIDAVAKSNPVLQQGKFYRAEWKGNSGTGANQELKIFIGEDTTPLIDLSGPITATGHRYAKVGNVAAVAGGVATLYIDTIRIGTDFVGPFGTPPSGGGAGTYVGEYLKTGGVWQNAVIDREAP